MSRKKSFKLSFLGILLLILGTSLTSFAGGRQGTPSDQRIGRQHTYSPGDGHEIPTPFDLQQFNKRVELASGEPYALWGEVNWPYFKVDLNRHPWLKSSSGVQKYYVLNGTAQYWEGSEGKYIQFFCKAKLKKVVFERGEERNLITLEEFKF